MQFELTVKEYSRIPEMVNLLQKYEIKNILLTQKDKYINNIEVAKMLKSSLPELDITLVFSVKENYNNNYQEVNMLFSEFMHEANMLNIRKILVVSGAPRKLYSSIDIFNFLKFRENKVNKFYCAYNPYLFNNLADEENERLRYKFASKILTGCYFQIGDDLIKLQSGIKTLKNVAKFNNEFFGSILIPNTFVLNNLKYKPWHGVKVSNDYLKNLNFAVERTKEILQIYKKNKITPLMSIQPFNDENIYRAFKTIINV